MVGKRVAARLRGESGFTIIEAVVALGIVFALVVALLRTMDSGTRVIIETKRQAAATAFGFSRVTWYQAKAQYDTRGLVGLLPRRRGPQLHPKKRSATSNPFGWLS